MSAVFDGSTNYLQNASMPLSTRPISFGFWFMPTTTSGSGIILDFSDASDANNVYVQQGTTAIHVTTNQTGPNTSGSTDFAGSLVAGKWAYVLVRWISPSNRRISVLSPDGSLDHGAADATSVSPGPLSRVTVGGGSGTFNSCSIAEFWYAGVDVQPDGLQSEDSLVIGLARSGPLKFPHIIKDLAEYHTYRMTPVNARDTYYGRYGRMTWTNNNGVVTGPHPPLRPDPRDWKVIVPV